MKTLYLFTLCILLSFSAYAADYNTAQKQSIYWATKTPAAAEKDIPSLGQYLGHVSYDDYTKALTIMCWVVQNLEYDEVAYQDYLECDEPLPNQSPDTVLKTRKAVCQGYAEMYQALCREVGLVCELIVGYAKGAGYEPGDHFLETNHVWNAVQIYGKWELVDATWADDDRTDGAPQWFYFCASPRQFIASHLPAKSNWQLLGKPCSKTEFEAMPLIYTDYFATGLEGYFPSGSCIHAKAGAIEVKLKHGRPEGMNCRLYWKSVEDKAPLHPVPQDTMVTDFGVILKGKLTHPEGGYLMLWVDTEDGENGWVLKYKVPGTKSPTVSAM